MDQDCREYILSEDYADFIIEYGQNLERFMQLSGTCQTRLNSTYAAVYAPINSLPSNIIQTYGYGVLPSCFGLLDTGSLEASGVTRIRNIPAFNLRGSNTLIGIIDTGIEYTHDAFKNADGTSRILSIWDQTIQTGTPPSGFFFGSEYTKENIDLALQNSDPLSIVPSTDTNGHGTMLAGIAAGNQSLENNFSGIATEAQIVVVKLKEAKKYLRDFFRIPEGPVCFSEIDIIFGINYLVQVANQVGLPMSICIGFGTSQGGHDERGALSSYLSTIGDYRGFVINIAAGNEGNRGHHFYGEIPSGTAFSTVELRVGPNSTGFSMELWGNAPSTFSIDLLSPTGEYIPRIPARIGETRVVNFIFEQTIIYIDYQLIEAQSGDELILLRFSNPTEGIWRFRIYSGNDLNSFFHIWLPITSFLDTEVVFLEPNPYTTLTSPGNTIIPIVLTAYDYSNNSLYLNASRGYTRTSSINPDIAAPGVNLVVPALNNGYTTSTGTSLAAAHCTGVAALILQWGIQSGYVNQLDSIEVKNLLLRGAKRDPNITYPNREWGYGILDLYSSFNSLRGETS